MSPGKKNKQENKHIMGAEDTQCRKCTTSLSEVVDCVGCNIYIRGVSVLRWSLLQEQSYEYKV